MCPRPGLSTSLSSLILVKCAALYADQKAHESRLSILSPRLELSTSAVKASLMAALLS